MNPASLFLLLTVIIVILVYLWFSWQPAKSRSTPPSPPPIPENPTYSLQAIPPATQMLTLLMDMAYAKEEDGMAFVYLLAGQIPLYPPNQTAKTFNRFWERWSKPELALWVWRKSGYFPTYAALLNFTYPHFEQMLAVLTENGWQVAERSVDNEGLKLYYLRKA